MHCPQALIEGIPTRPLRGLRGPDCFGLTHRKKLEFVSNAIWRDLLNVIRTFGKGIHVHNVTAV